MHFLSWLQKEIELYVDDHYRSTVAAVLFVPIDASRCVDCYLWHLPVQICVNQSLYSFTSPFVCVSVTAYHRPLQDGAKKAIMTINFWSLLFDSQSRQVGVNPLW